MNIRFALICIAVSLNTGCAWFDFSKSDTESIGATVTGTDQAVEQFLTGRDLDPVEGAWQHEEHAFEVIISRNDFAVAGGYDYIGIITRSDEPRWNKGDVKLLLRSTDSNSVFEGVWMTRNKAKQEMTFVAQNRNLIQAKFVSHDGNAYFVRIRRMTPRFAGAL